MKVILVCKCCKKIQTPTKTTNYPFHYCEGGKIYVTCEKCTN